MAAQGRQAETLDSFTLPLLWDGAAEGTAEEGTAAGTAEAVREGLYLRFRIRLPVRAGLWRVWLAGEDGAARLGTPEPSGGELLLTRRLSVRSLAPLGRLLRCEVRPASEDGGQPALECQRDSGPPAPEPQGDNGQPVLADRPDILPRPGGGVLLAYPLGGPFPLPSLFCFARLDGNRWLFAFDAHGRPVF